MPIWVLIGTGFVGFILAIVQGSGLWEFAEFAGDTTNGDSTRFEEIVIGLISLLLIANGFELASTTMSIKEGIDLSPNTPLATKLERIEHIASAEGRLSSIGLDAFYVNRREANKGSPIADFLQSASSDLLICALSADVLIHYQGDLFKELLTNECNVRFLLPQRSLLENESQIQHLAPSGDISRTPDHIGDALKFLRHLDTDARLRDLKGKLEVRFLEFIPTMGFVVIDGSSRKGRIRVEQYVYKSPVVDRPSYEVIPTPDGRGLYHFLQKQFEQCWIDATEWEAPTVSTLAPDAGQMQT